MERYISQFVRDDLKRKMVFIGGPRQAGKTTLAKDLLSEVSLGAYFNWDSDRDRRAIKNEDWDERSELVVFDELHKYKPWKNWIKGIYDTLHEKHQLLVTGSARLDVYRRGGDSLLGRYHYWRLHPLSLHEIPEGITGEQMMDRLLRLGGFPEPLLENSERAARRWRQERAERILKDDVRDLEGLKDIQRLGMLLDLLRERVGSPVVYSNLAEDLQTTSPTIANWIEVLERMYVIFKVKPYSTNISRAIHKPPKIYFFDNADVKDDVGMRFENLVATHLLKQIHFLRDRDGYDYELSYIRDKEKREVDFAIIKEKKVLTLIEAKWSDAAISPSLLYYGARLKPKRCLQIVGELKKDFEKAGVLVSHPIRCLTSLEEFKPLYG